MIIKKRFIKFFENLKRTKNQKIRADVEETFDTQDELVDVYSGISNFMKKFDIGYNVKSFSQEKGATKQLRKIIQKILDPAKLKPEVSATELKQKLKDELQKYQDGKPNIKDYEFERVARTELSSARNAGKLIRWRAQGWQTVRHITDLSPNTGKQDREYNGTIWPIDFLLQHEESRVPLHPNCRCDYVRHSKSLSEKQYKDLWKKATSRNREWKNKK